MVCFDTDFLIAFLNKNPDALKKLEDLEAKGSMAACTTTVNVAELYKSVYRAHDRQIEIDRVKRLLDTLHLLTLDGESARLVGELDAEMKSSAIGDLDVFIAGIAMTNGETLVTRNIRHFERVPGLKVESW